MNFYAAVGVECCFVRWLHQQPNLVIVPSKLSILCSCRWCLAMLPGHAQTHNDGVLFYRNTNSGGVNGSVQILVRLGREENFLKFIYAFSNC